MEEKRCYTVKEVARTLGVCRQTVYKLLKEKEFASTKVGGNYRINKKTTRKIDIAHTTINLR